VFVFVKPRLFRISALMVNFMPSCNKTLFKIYVCPIKKVSRVNLKKSDFICLYVCDIP